MDFVIAVDGPAASGKGTVAAYLAAELVLPHLDTGLLYRAVGHTAAVVTQPYAILPDGYGLVGMDSEAFRQAAVTMAVALVPDALEDPRLRTRAVGELASRVAMIPEVRAALLDFQRRFAAQPGGAVVDGRDIGTVIAPDAPAKLYVTASPEVRADRRWRQLVAQGEDVALGDVLADIRRRDDRDAGRDAAPMVMAADAVLLDTTEMDISTAVEAARRIVQAARSRWERSRSG